MNDRQDTPASRNQRYQLDRLGVSYPDTLSRGQAAELLSRHQAPTDDQRRMLRFFDIDPGPFLTRHAAMRQLTSLMSVPSNRARWEARLCSAEQREILHFFKLPVRAGLKFIDADRLIEILLGNPRYALRWDRYETRKFARQTWFERNFDYVNDVAAYYGCSQLSLESFTAVVTSLEARGMSLRDIEDDYQALFLEALTQQPQLQRVKQVL